jgi:hypothetical protein
MGDYYNATRGPLSASLTDGSALSLGPKRWIFISPENENSASIIKLLDKGFLVKSSVPRTDPNPAPAAAVVAPAPVPAPAPAPETVSVDPSASTSPVKEEILRKKK